MGRAGWFTPLVIPEAAKRLSGTHCAACKMGPFIRCRYEPAMHRCALHRARDDSWGFDTAPRGWPMSVPLSDVRGQTPPFPRARH